MAGEPRITHRGPDGRIVAVPVEDRFWRHVDKSGDCWLWTGAKDTYGYGLFFPERRRRVGAHRMAWLLSGGGIPDGFQLDHLCRVRACVNPAHLDIVTSRENTLRGDGPSARQARQTHCKNGHPLSGANLWVITGKRRCKQCHDDYRRTYEAARREA